MTPKEVDAIIRHMTEAGRPRIEICAETGLSPHCVSDRRAAMGIARVVDSGRREIAVRLLLAGKTDEEIAKATGYSVHTAHDIRLGHAKIMRDRRTKFIPDDAAPLPLPRRPVIDPDMSLDAAIGWLSGKAGVPVQGHPSRAGVYIVGDETMTPKRVIAECIDRQLRNGGIGA